MRQGFDGLARLVQEVLGRDPFSGHVFAFRGRRGHLVKLLFWDGQGLCLYAKRLDRGKFVWPAAQGGVVSLTPAQLSAPVATKFTTAEHWPGALQTVTLLGHCTVGFSQSLTVTVNEHCWLLPAASVAVTTTVVVPIGKVEPEAGLATTVGAPQLSAPDALNVTTAPQLPASAQVVISDGHWTVGASQSVTVTLNAQVEVRPAASVAPTLTVVVPTGKLEPEAGVAETV